DYKELAEVLIKQKGETSIDQRRLFAVKAFDVVKRYDIAISNYFNREPGKRTVVLRYGENPHQSATFAGELSKVFQQLQGKEISYNNLVDIDAGIQLMKKFDEKALKILGSRKNRILLKLSENIFLPEEMYKSALNGRLQQDIDKGSYLEWKEVGGHETTPIEKADLQFANIVCKHLKSNAIA